MLSPFDIRFHCSMSFIPNKDLYIECIHIVNHGKNPQKSPLLLCLCHWTLIIETSRLNFSEHL